MCGLTGIFDTTNADRIDPDVLGRMAHKVKHRGPDAFEFYRTENLGFGFARLSIVDLGGGMQPMFNEDRSVVLMCNGEIYNHAELREELGAQGHVFSTQCDVEVILHLYEQHGVDFINRLNGQFAFAIYDAKRRLLLAARDHFGIQPFFYTVADGLFIFGSEIKAIIEHPSVRREVDLLGLDQILTFPGLISPRTMFRGVHSLKSGHYLVVGEGRGPEVSEYWDLIYHREGELEYVEDESFYVEKLDELLTRAVKYRLMADVPVGFYLSGGLDSSLIAAKIKEMEPSGSHRMSFSIDFPDRLISESKYQRMMARHVGSEHHEFLFQLDDISSRLQKVVYHCECALKETLNTATLALSESVHRQGMRVVLSGQGADEIFAGYVGYRFDRFRQKKAPQKDVNTILEDELRRKLWGDENFFYERDYIPVGRVKRDLYSAGVKARLGKRDALHDHVIDKERIDGVGLLHKRSYVDAKLRLCDHLLSDLGDRMSMANSVEARYPFLDQDLVEFTRFIPPHLKLKGFEEKYVLKRVAEGGVPKEIIDREKFGFSAPGSPYLLGENIEYINDLLSHSRIKREGYFNPETVEALRKRYTEPGFRINVPFDSDLLIVVITFGIFLEVFDMPCLG